jgi:hypothetical protein
LRFLTFAGALLLPMLRYSASIRSTMFPLFGRGFDVMALPLRF